MSAEVIEQGLDRGPINGNFLDPLFQGGVKRRLRSFDYETARDRLDVVLDVWRIDDLSPSTIQGVMKNWSLQSKDDVLRYLSGSQDTLEENTILEVDTSLKNALADETTRQLHGYGDENKTEYVVPVIPAIDELNWKEYAACLESSNTDAIFFPEGQRGRAKLIAIGIGKKVCGWCDVRHICREAAREGNEQYGTWGGVPADERDEVK